MTLKKTQENLKMYLLWHVSISILIGWTLGYFKTVFIEQPQFTLKTLITGVVFLVLYPVMDNIRLDALAKTLYNLKGVGLTLV